MQVKAPWYFDCSNHPEWDSFRRRFTEFRARFSSEDRESPALVDMVSDVLMEANHLGKTYEATFVKWASSWDIFYLCNETAVQSVAEELKTDFCFYGFVVVQWLGIFGFKHFGNVPGMADWAHHARGFLNDASKFNAMHYLESSGWPVKLVELAQTLSISFSGDYKPARDLLPPGVWSRGRPEPNEIRRSPPHTQAMQPKPLRAVAISYHTALIREPLTFWARALGHRFAVEAAVHVLDPTARSAEDVRKLHSHCQFIEGAWCASDERLLQLNDFFDSVLLSGHTGDHKTKHHFIRDTAAYHRLFVELFDGDAEMRAADLFMCGEPVFFCQLLSHFGRPVVGYISTPLSVYVARADREAWYQSFYDMALDPRHYFAVTTPIFAEWTAYATGVALPVVRPACLYTEASYWPVRSREVLVLRTVSLFWDAECILNHFAKEAFAAQAAGGADGDAADGLGQLRFVESTTLSGKDRVGYSAFAEFRATIIYPYAFSQFWFYELYAMAVPVYMPSRATMPLFVNQDYSVCPDFDGHRPGHVPNLVHPFSPFDVDDWDAMTYWTGFTDYLLTPHVNYFESLPQLMYLLERNDHRAQSRAMHRANAEFTGQATTFWASVLDRVAAAAGAAEVPAEPAGAAPPELRERYRGLDLSGDELRDLSTRQPSGGSPARSDGAHRKANDGDTSQKHPSEYHFDALRAGDASHSYWWVRLRRLAVDPEVKLWPRDCCSESFGHRLWLLLSNTTDREAAVECAALDIADGEMRSTVCRGAGEYLFVEARAEGGWGYDPPGMAVLMLPEVRVLSRD